MRFLSKVLPILCFIMALSGCIQESEGHTVQKGFSSMLPYDGQTLLAKDSTHVSSGFLGIDPAILVNWYTAINWVKDEYESTADYEMRIAAETMIPIQGDVGISSEVSIGGFRVTESTYDADARLLHVEIFYFDGDAVPQVLVGFGADDKGTEHMFGVYFTGTPSFVDYSPYVAFRVSIPLEPAKAKSVRESLRYMLTGQPGRESPIVQKSRHVNTHYAAIPFVPKELVIYEDTTGEILLRANMPIEYSAEERRNNWNERSRILDRELEESRQRLRDLGMR